MAVLGAAQSGLLLVLEGSSEASPCISPAKGQASGKGLCSRGLPFPPYRPHGVQHEKELCPVDGVTESN